MKIGLVLSQTPSYSETFFISKIKGLQKSGFEVMLFVQQKDSNFSVCPVKVAPKVYIRNVLLQGINALIVLLKLMVYPKRCRAFLKLENEAHRTIKQIIKNTYNNSHILMADLDWLHFGFATIALQSEHVAKAIGAKMAVSFRGFDVAIYPLKHKDCYHHLWKYVDKVHTISDDLLSIAYTLGMPKPLSFAKITPAIDTSQFVFQNRENLGFNTVSILTVGRLHWKKGLTLALEALALLKEHKIHFKYTIVGNGPEFEPLLYAIHQLGLTEHITLIGKKSHQDVISLMGKSDIYLQYSISEGFCNAVLEAQAMGCLCIVSDAEGLAENVLDDQTGWVVPKNHTQLLAEALVKVIYLPDDEKRRISKNAQERVRQTFNLDFQREQFAAFYRS